MAVSTLPEESCMPKCSMQPKPMQPGETLSITLLRTRKPYIIETRIYARYSDMDTGAAAAQAQECAGLRGEAY